MFNKEDEILCDFYEDFGFIYCVFDVNNVLIDGIVKIFFI